MTRHALSQEPAGRAGIRRSVPVPLAMKDGRSVFADFVSFHNLPDNKEHVALVFAGANDAAEPLVRLHSECLTGDVFASQKCDCGPQLDEAMERMAAQGGVILYLRQEGRGIGLYNKLDAYALQAEQQLDTFEANKAIGHVIDGRDYQAAAEMLFVLGMPEIALLSNNPDKKAQLERHGVTVTRMIPTGLHEGPHNARYISAKRKAGHRFVE